MAEQADQLTVFQRTATYAVPAHNRALDPEEQAEVKADYAGLRKRNREMVTAFGSRTPPNPEFALMTDPEAREAEFERRWEQGGLLFLGAYSDLTVLPPAARRLVPVVAAVDLLDQLAWLMEIAYLEDNIANDPAQPFIRGAIKVLLRSLEQLTNVLAPPEPGTRRPGGGRPPRTAAPRGSRAPRTPAAGRSRGRSTRRRRGEG